MAKDIQRFIQLDDEKLIQTLSEKKEVVERGRVVAAELEKFEAEMKTLEHKAQKLIEKASKQLKKAVKKDELGEYEVFSRFELKEDGSVEVEVVDLLEKSRDQITKKIKTMR